MPAAEWAAFSIVVILQFLILFFLWALYRKPVSVPAAAKSAPPAKTMPPDPKMESSQNRHPFVDEKWREEVKRTVELQCLSIRNAVFKQTIDIHQREIELAPKSFLFDEDILEEVYTAEELAVLNTFMDLFQTYLNHHWYTSQQQLKSVFSGRISNVESEAGKLVHRSKYLCSNMDQLLRKLTFTNIHG